MSLRRLEELFPAEIEACLAACPLLVLPLGTIEWHSHHLPLGLDGLVAQSLCERIAAETGAVLAPVSYWAVGGVPYPYTLDLPAETVEPVLEAILAQFGAMGFRVLVAFTGHFGLDHTLALKRAALHVMKRSPVTILPITEYDLVTDHYTGDHAGTGETSLLLASRPDLVRLDAVAADQTLDGVIGPDPRGTASTALGETLADTIVERAQAMAKRLLAGTTALERASYIDALSAGVAVLAKTSQQRRLVPKSQVPPLTTPAYLSYCQALYTADYRAARAYAERKLADLTA